MFNQKKITKMNTKEKELLGAINGTERMSGYDGSEGDMSFFDGDEFDSFDGDDMSYFDGDDMSYASGSKSQAVSDPYVLQYENTTSGALTAVLFGFNDYFGQGSYNGNPTGIVVTNLQGGTYTRLVSQSNNKPFKIAKWRFQCSNASQLAVTLSVNHTDANGKSTSTPVNLSIMRDAYQQQSDIIDVTRPVTVDANTNITFSLLAGALLTISMFPVEIISSKARLNGRSGLATAKAPRLSGKNVAPVIIQTSQGVGGISKR